MTKLHIPLRIFESDIFEVANAQTHLDQVSAKVGN